MYLEALFFIAPVILEPLISSTSWVIILIEVLVFLPYFFVDILREGILLYDRGNYALETPKQSAKKKAEAYFAYWVEKGAEFYDDFQGNVQKERYNKAAFELHQAPENYYAAFSLVSPTTSPRRTILKI